MRWKSRWRQALEFNQQWGELSRYNSEVARGLIHTAEWKAKMAKKQEEFRVVTLRDTRVRDTMVTEREKVLESEIAELKAEAMAERTRAIAAESELQELKAENDRMHKGWPGVVRVWETRATTAEASLAASEERGRKLEEALREIIERKHHDGRKLTYRYDEGIARAALSSEEEDNG